MEDEEIWIERDPPICCDFCELERPRFNNDAISYLTAIQDGWKLKQEQKFSGIAIYYICPDCQKQRKK